MELFYLSVEILYCFLWRKNMKFFSVKVIKYVKQNRLIYLLTHLLFLCLNIASLWSLLDFIFCGIGREMLLFFLLGSWVENIFLYRYPRIARTSCGNTRVLFPKGIVRQFVVPFIAAFANFVTWEKWQMIGFQQTFVQRWNHL